MFLRWRQLNAFASSAGWMVCSCDSDCCVLCACKQAKDDNDLLCPFLFVCVLILNCAICVLRKVHWDTISSELNEQGILREGLRDLKSSIKHCYCRHDKRRAIRFQEIHLAAGQMTTTTMAIVAAIGVVEAESKVKDLPQIAQ